MKKRPYGKTGINLSVVGFGGILVADESTSEAARLVSKAVDAGVNYFDVAPQYGNAQEMLGPALQPFRKDVFLACKTLERNADRARIDLENSLKLLKTDYFDLYQLHAVKNAEEVNAILAHGGALEAFQKAREEGMVRHLGFSAHSEEAALALLDAFGFDSVLFPLNAVTWYGGDFGKKVVEKTNSKGIPLLALKTLAQKKIPQGEMGPSPKAWYWPVESPEEAQLHFNFTLSIPGVTAAVSPGIEQLFDWMTEAEKNYRPLNAEEENQLKAKAEKLVLIFDAHHSEWTA